jgi:hypothetical protein
VAETAAIYDGTSYHQGSVWPLYTGWAALAEYRSGHPLAGYQALMQNADLTTAQDPGAVTELLSGTYFEPFGRSTSHQLWSSAMVVTPLLRGMFGVRVDAAKHAVTVTPHLPATWLTAEIHRLRVGDSVVDLLYQRVAGAMNVTLDMKSGAAVHFTSGGTSTRVPLPDVEVSMTHGLPQRGARTTQLKVMDEQATANSLKLDLEGMGGSESTLTLVRNHVAGKVRAAGAELVGDQIHVHFAAGSGYVTQTVTLSW